MFNNLKNYFYLIHLCYVFLKNIKNTSHALEVLGPSFIKLGQFLSTRPDIIGYDKAEALAYLRDRLPSQEFSKVDKYIDKSFFSSIDPQAIAAASIAQVHQGFTNSGDKVAIKIRRPKIKDTVDREMNFMHFAANKFEFFFPKLKRLKLPEVVALIDRNIRFELDLSFEAAAASELYEQCSKLPFIKIPKVDWLRTNEKIFTMEWVDGISIYEIDTLAKSGVDLKLLAQNLVVMFFNQAFVHGYFHADLHQGNILVNPEGQIILLDFGIMGRLDYQNRVYIARILHGFLNRDYALIAELHHQAGYLNKKYCAKQFAQCCRSIGEPIMNLPPEQISIASLLGKLFKMMDDFQMETQPQLLLMQKTMIMVEGIGKQLYPEANLWQLAEPWIKKWAKDNLSFEAKSAKTIRKVFDAIIEKINL